MPLGINLVDHCSQSGGFAGTCRARHQHQAAGLFTQLSDHSWQAELAEILDLKWNNAEHSRCRSSLVKCIGAEACQTLKSEREVEFQMLFETMLL